MRGARAGGKIYSEMLRDRRRKNKNPVRTSIGFIDEDLIIEIALVFRFFLFLFATFTICISLFLPFLLLMSFSRFDDRCGSSKVYLQSTD